MGLDIPLHYVRTPGYIYAPTSLEIAEEEFHNAEFTCGELTPTMFLTPELLVEACYKHLGKQPPFEVKRFIDIKNTTVNKGTCKEHYIFSLSSYFEAYDIFDCKAFLVYKVYDYKAPYLIRSNAQTYIDRMKLSNGEVSTEAAAYDSQSEYPFLYELLRKMGQQLIEERDGKKFELVEPREKKG